MFISGPVSANFTELNGVQYIFFGEYHGSPTNTCKDAKIICKGKYHPEVTNCYKIIGLLSEMFIQASEKQEYIDFFIETGYTKSFIHKKPHEDVLFRIENYFNNCFNKKNCEFDTTRFHYVDIRKVDGRLENSIANYFYTNKYIRYLNALYENNGNVREALIYKLHKILMTSDDVVNDIEKLFLPVLDNDRYLLTKVLPREITVKRNGKIMHRVRAQLEDLENDGNGELANKIVSFILEREVKFLENYFISDAESKKNYYLSFEEHLILDAYFLARLFRSYKRYGYHEKSNKNVIYAGQAHIETYLDFFETVLGAKMSINGVRKNKINSESFPRAWRCVKVSEEDFNKYLLSEQKRTETEDILTGDLSEDRNRLLNLGDRELLNTCSFRYAKRVCDDDFWRARIRKN